MILFKQGYKNTIVFVFDVRTVPLRTELLLKLLQGFVFICFVGGTSYYDEGQLFNYYPKLLLLEVS